MTNSLIYYRKKLVTTTEQSVVTNADNDSLANDIVFGEGVNYLVLPVTSEQYQNLLSATINGVFTTFPENPIGVLYPLIKAGKVSICDAIISCLNDPESGVSDAIYNLLGGDSYQSNREYGQSQNDNDLSSLLNPTCDKDILFGQATQLVDYMDSLNVDFFEILEVASNTGEFLAQVVGDISFIDESSVDSVFAWLAFIQNSIAENYLAQVTQAYKDDIACEIFCRANENCEITPRILFDVFKDRLSASVTVESVLWDTLDFLVGGTWTGTQIADFMFMSQLALRSQLGKYFDKIAYQDIETRLTLFSNDPDSDWAILCSACPDTWEYEIDFTVDQGTADGWSQGVWGNGWVSGKGWRSEYFGSAPHIQNLLIVENQFSLDTTVTYVEFDIVKDGTATNFGADVNQQNMATILKENNVQVFRENYFTSTQPIPTILNQLDYPPGHLADYIQIAWNPTLGNPNLLYLSRVLIRGTGTNPFV